jgi:hypothetical protein
MSGRVATKTDRPNGTAVAEGRRKVERAPATTNFSEPTAAFRRVSLSPSFATKYSPDLWGNSGISPQISRNAALARFGSRAR